MKRHLRSTTKKLESDLSNSSCIDVKRKKIVVKSKNEEGDGKQRKQSQEKVKGLLEKQNSSSSKLCENDLVKLFNVRQDNLRRLNVISSTQVFRKLCDSFETARDEGKSQQMAKYMRFKFEYFGIQSPLRKEICKPLWKDAASLGSSDLRTLICETWHSPERELQYFAVDVFERELQRIYVDDRLSEENYALSTLDFVRQFLACLKSWWDTVDPLATRVVGSLVKKYPDILLPVLDKWNVSSNIWLVRTSIIYQLHYGKDTDSDRLFRYCLKVSHEEEFFIQKAIGWALRQHFRTDPQLVRDFVMKNNKKLPKLSMREALKHDK